MKPSKGKNLFSHNATGQEFVHLLHIFYHLCAADADCEIFHTGWRGSLHS